VKVLDFGLAKAMAGDPMVGSGSHDLSQSPTNLLPIEGLPGVTRWSERRRRVEARRAGTVD